MKIKKRKIQRGKPKPKSIMKKSLLLVCSLALVVGASAQNRVSNVATRPSLKENSCTDGTVSHAVIKSERKTPLVLKKNPSAMVVADVITGGQAGNAYGGFTRSGRSILNYNDALNSLTLIHRSCPACGDPTANTGHYMFDFSKDGGMTWVGQQGPAYSPGTYVGRYPTGGIIHNPTGNLIPDSAYISWSGVGLNGTAWDSYPHGSTQLGMPAITMQAIDTFNTPSFLHQGLIPSSMTLFPSLISLTSSLLLSGSSLSGI